MRPLGMVQPTTLKELKTPTHRPKPAVILSQGELKEIRAQTLPAFVSLTSRLEEREKLHIIM